MSKKYKTLRNFLATASLCSTFLAASNASGVDLVVTGNVSLNTGVGVLGGVFNNGDNLVIPSALPIGFNQISADKPNAQVSISTLVDLSANPITLNVSKSVTVSKLSTLLPLTKLGPINFSNNGATATLATPFTNNLQFSKVDFLGQNSTLLLNDGVTFASTVNNTGATNNGTLTFAGSGGVSAAIGSTNTLLAVNFNGAGAVNLGNTVKATTLTIANAGANVTANGLLTGGVNYTAAGTLTANAGLKGDVDFKGDKKTHGIFNLGAGQTIDGDITSSVNNGYGSLNFIGGGTVTGGIGADIANHPATINIQGDNSTTVNLNNNIFANQLVFANPLGVASTVKLGGNLTVFTVIFGAKGGVLEFDAATTFSGKILNGVNAKIIANANVTVNGQNAGSVNEIDIADNTVYTIDTINGDVDLLNNGAKIVFLGANSELDIVNSGGTNNRVVTLYNNLVQQDAGGVVNNVYGKIGINAVAGGNLSIASNGGAYTIGQDATHRLASVTFTGDGNITVDPTIFAKVINMNNTGTVTLNQPLDNGAGGGIVFGTNGELVVNGVTGAITTTNPNQGTLTINNGGDIGAIGDAVNNLNLVNIGGGIRFAANVYASTVALTNTNSGLTIIGGNTINGTVTNNTGVDNSGRLLLGDNSNVTGAIGVAGAALKEVIILGDVQVGNVYAESAVLIGDNSILRLTSNDLKAPVITVNANKGIITIGPDTYMLHQIGEAGKAIEKITSSDNKPYLTFYADVYANIIELPSKLILNDNVTVTGAITTTAGDNTQQLILGNNSNVTGTIGSAGAALKEIIFNGITTLGNTANAQNFTINNVNANVTASGLLTGGVSYTAAGTLIASKGITGDIDFAGNNGTFNLGTGQTITGNVDSSTALGGILEFTGAGTVTGAVGATNPLTKLKFSGAGNINIPAANATTFEIANVATNVTASGLLTGGVNYTAAGVMTANAGLKGDVDFKGIAGTFNLGAGQTVTGSVTSIGGNGGTVNFVGSGTVTGGIGLGSASIDLTRINIQGDNTTIVRLEGVVYAQQLYFANPLGGASIVKLGGNSFFTNGVSFGNGGVLEFNAPGRIRLAILNGSKGKIIANANVTVNGQNAGSVNEVDIADNTIYTIDTINGDVDLLNNGAKIVFLGSNSELDIVNSGGTNNRVVTLYNNLVQQDAGGVVADVYGKIGINTVAGGNLNITSNGGAYTIGQDATHRLASVTFTGDGAVTIDPTIFAKVVNMNNTGTVTLSQPLNTGVGGGIVFGTNGELVVNGVTGAITTTNPNQGTLTINSNKGYLPTIGDAVNNLNLVNINNALFGADIYASIVALTSEASALTGSNDGTINGAVTNTTGIDNSGRLILGDNSNVTGAIGVAGAALREITFYGITNLGNTANAQNFTIDADRANVTANGLLTGGVNYTAAGTLTANAGLKGGVDFKGNNGTFNLGAGQTVTGAINSTGGVTGTVNFVGSGTVVSFISANVINIQGDNTTTVNLNNNIFANQLVFANPLGVASTVKLGANLTVPTVDFGAKGGVLEFDAPGTFSGNILNGVNAKIIANANVTVNGQNAGSVNEIDIADNTVYTIDAVNGDVDLLNNGAKIVFLGANSELDIVNSGGANNRVVTLYNNLVQQNAGGVVNDVYGKIGINAVAGGNLNITSNGGAYTIGQYRLASVTFTGDGNITVDPTIFAKVVNMNNTGTVTLSQPLDDGVGGGIVFGTNGELVVNGVTGAITTTNPNQGILTINKVTSDINAGDAVNNLNLVNIGINFVSIVDVYAKTIALTKINSELLVRSNHTINGAVTNTSGIDNSGILFFGDDSNVTGAIGLAGAALKRIDFSGTTNLGNTANAQNFTIDSAGGKIANVTASGLLTGEVEYTAAGVITANAGIKGDVDFKGIAGTFNLGAGQTLDGAVTSTTLTSGTLGVLGDGTITGKIDNLNILQFSGGNRTTLDLQKNVTAKSVVFVNNPAASGTINVNGGLNSGSITFNNGNADGGTLVINAPTTVGGVINPDNGTIIVNANFTITDPNAGNIEKIDIADNTVYTIDAVNGDVNLLNNGAKIVFLGSNSELDIVNSGGTNNRVVTLYNNLVQQDAGGVVNNVYGKIGINAVAGGNLSIASNGGAYTIGQDATHRLASVTFTGDGNITVDPTIFAKVVNMNNTGMVTLSQPLNTGAGGGIVFGTNGELIVNGVTGAITTTNPNQGTLTINNGGDIGAIGDAVNNLNLVNIGNGIRFAANVYASTVAFNTDSNLVIIGGNTINGAVTNTTGIDNSGRLNLGNNSNVIGAIGLAGAALREITFYGITNLGNTANAQSFFIGSAGANVTASGLLTGGVSYAAGTLTANAGLKGNVDFKGNNGTFNLGAGQTIDGAIYNKGNTAGTVNFVGSGTVTGGIGADAANSPATINIQGDNSTTVNLNNNIFANQLVFANPLGVASTVKLGGNLTVPTVDFGAKGGVLEFDTAGTFSGSILNGVNAKIIANANVTVNGQNAGSVNEVDIADNTIYTIDTVNGDVDLLNNGAKIVFLGANSELDIVNSGGANNRVVTLYNNLFQQDAGGVVNNVYGKIGINAVAGGNLNITSNGGAYTIGQDTTHATHRLASVTFTGDGAVTVDPTIFAKVVNMNNTGTVTLNQPLNMGADGGIVFGANGELIVNGVTGAITTTNPNQGTLTINSNNGYIPTIGDAVNNLNLVNINNALFGADVYASTVALTSEASVLTLSNNRTINGAVTNTTGVNNSGRLNLGNNSNVTGAIGVAGAALREITFYGITNLGNTANAQSFTIIAADANVTASGLLTGGVSYTAAGTLTANAGLKGGVDFKGNNGTFNLGAGQTVTGAINSTGGVAGTVNFVGSGTVTGGIGADAANSPATINIQGDNSTTVNLNNNIFANQLVFANPLGVASTVKLGGNLTVPTVDFGAKGGVLEFDTAGTFSGSILNGVNAKIIANANVTVNGQNAGSVNEVDIADNTIYTIDTVNGDVDLLNNGAKIVFLGANSELDIVNSGGANNRVVTLYNNLVQQNAGGVVNDVYGKIGINAVAGGNLNITSNGGAYTIGQYRLASVTFTGDGNITVDPTIFAKVVNMNNTGTVTLSQPLDNGVGGGIVFGTNGELVVNGVTGAITTTNPNQGILTINKVTSDINAGDAVNNLNLVNIGINLVPIGDVYAKTIALTKINSKLLVRSNHTINGAVTNTTGIDNSGILLFGDDSNVTGAIGLAGAALRIVDFSGTTNLGNTANAQNFTIGSAGGKIANVTANGLLTGGVSYTAAGTMTANAGLKGDVDFEGNNGTFNLGAGQTVDGAVTSTGPTSGTLGVLGNGTITGKIDNLNILQFSGGNGTTLNLQKNVTAKSVVFVNNPAASGTINVNGGLNSGNITFNNGNADGGTLVINAPTTVGGVINPDNGTIIVNANFTITDPNAGNIEEIDIADNTIYTIDAVNGDVDLLNNGAKIVFLGANSELDIVNSGGTNNRVVTLYNNLVQQDAGGVVADVYGKIGINTVAGGNLNITSNGGAYTIGQDATHRLASVTFTGDGAVTIDPTIFAKVVNMNNTGTVTLSQPLNTGVGGGIVFGTNGELVVNGVTGAITTTNPNQGILTINKVTNDINAGDAVNNLNLVNIGINLVQIVDVYAKTIALTKINSELLVRSNHTINGAVTNTTGIDNSGRLILGLNSNVTGTIGSAGAALREITFYGITNLGNTANAQSFDINKASANVTASGLLTGEVNYTAAGTLTANAGLKGDVDFKGKAGTFNLGAGQTVTGAINSTGGIAGTVNFVGSGTVTGGIGADIANHPATINIQGDNTTTVNLNNNIFANQLVFANPLGVASTVKLGANLTVPTVDFGAKGGVLEFDAPGTFSGNILNGVNAKIIANANVTVNGQNAGSVNEIDIADNTIYTIDAVNGDVDLLNNGAKIVFLGANSELDIVNSGGANNRVVTLYNNLVQQNAGGVVNDVYGKIGINTVAGGNLNITSNGGAYTIGQDTTHRLASVTFTGDGAVTVDPTIFAKVVNMNNTGMVTLSQPLDNGAGGGIVFGTNGELVVNGVTGAITTTNPNQGTLTINNGGDIGAIGDAVNNLNLVNIGGSNIRFAANVYASTVAFNTDSNLVIIGGNTINGAVTNTTGIDNSGRLIFGLDSNVTGAIGLAGAALKRIDFSGTTNLGNTANAQNFIIGSAGGKIANVTASGLLTGEVNYTAAGTLTANAGLKGDVDFEGNNGTFNLGVGQTLDGAVTSTGVASGTLGVLGDGTITGEIDNLNILQFSGGNGTTLNLQKNVTAKSVVFVNNPAASGTINVNGGLNSGNITFNNGNADGGTLVINAPTTVGGVINPDNGTIIVNANFTITDPNAGNIEKIDIADNTVYTIDAVNGDVDLLNNGAKIVFLGANSELDLINSGGTNNRVVTLYNNLVQQDAGGVVADVYGKIGINTVAGGNLNITSNGGAYTIGQDATHRLASVTFTGDGAVTIDPTIFAKVVNMNNTGTVTLNQPLDNGAGGGVIFDAAGTLVANAGLKGDVDFKGKAGTFNLGASQMLTGTVTSTGGAANGTLGVIGNSIITGAITNLGILNFTSVAGDSLELQANVNVNNINFVNKAAASGVINLGDSLTTQMVSFNNGDVNGGTLQFSGADAAGYNFSANIQNPANGTLNVYTKLTASNAAIGTINTINIGNNVTPQVFTIAVNMANLVLDNTNINFGNIGSTLALSPLADQIVTFNNTLKGVANGGGIVSLNGNGHTLTLQGDNGATLGSGGKAINTLNINGNVTIAGGGDLLDVRNVNILNIKNGAVFTDHSVTSALINNINIGEAAGAAIYVLDAANGDFNLNTGGINFVNEDSTLSLENTGVIDHIITLMGPLDPRADLKGIVELNSVNNTQLTIADNGDVNNTLGTKNHRLKQLTFSGNGTFVIEPDINVEMVELNLNEIELGIVNAKVVFNKGTIYSAIGNINGNVDFKGFAGVINFADNVVVNGSVTSTGNRNGILNFLGAGEVTKAITNVAMLKVGAGNVALSAGDNYSISEIQGSGTNNLTFGNNFNLTGGINTSGGQAVKLIFTNGGSVSGSIGLNSPVGNITVQNGMVNFANSVSSGDIVISNGATVQVAGNVKATNITGNLANSGTLKLNNPAPITIASPIGNGNPLNTIEVANANVTVTSSTNTKNILFSNAAQAATLTLFGAANVENVTTAGNNIHSLEVNDFTSGTGSVGTATNMLKSIELIGNGLVTINSNNFYSGVTTANNNQGNVKLNSDGAFVNDLGSNTQSLNNVEFSQNGTAKGDVYSTNINVKSGKTATFDRGGNASSPKSLIVPDVMVDVTPLPRSIQTFNYFTDIDSTNFNLADATASANFKDATLVKTPINGGVLTFNDNVWLKETISNAAKITFSPGKFALLEKNITAATMIADRANIVLLNDLEIKSNLTARDATIDLANKELKYTGNVGHSGVLNIIAYFDTALQSGGHILVGSGGKFDLSALDQLVIQIKSRSNINLINSASKHYLVRLEDGSSSFSPVAKGNIVVQGEDDNKFVQYASDATGLVLMTADGLIITPPPIVVNPGPVLMGATAGNPTATGVATQLMNAMNTQTLPAGSDAATLLNDLGYNKTPSAVKETLARLGGRNNTEEGASEGISVFTDIEIQDVLTDIAIDIDNQVFGNIDDRLDGLNDPSQPSSTLSDTKAKNNRKRRLPAVAVGAGDDDNISSGVWGVPFYGKAIQKSKNGESGYKSKAGGGIIGFDYAVNNQLVVGAAYTRAETKLRHQNDKIGDRTKAASDVYSLYGLYNWLNSNFFAEAIASYGKSRIKNYEKRLTSNGDQNALGKFTNTSYSGELLGGYNYALLNFSTLTPMLGLRYSTYKNNSYKETGTTFQNLSVRRNSYNKFEGILGLKGVTNIFVEDVLLKPEIHGFVNYNFKGKLPSIDARLDGLDEPLVTTNFKAAKVNYTVGTGITARYKMMEFGIKYNLTLAKKYVGNQGALKLKVNF